MGKNTKRTAKGRVVGTLSGIDLSGVDAVPRDERGMQDFNAMLTAAGDAPVVDAAAAAATDLARAVDNRTSRLRDKPKKTLRFSIDDATNDAVGGGGGGEGAAAAASPSRRSREASRAGTAEKGSQRQNEGARKVARKITSVRVGPLSPSALSVASTAPPSSAAKKHDDDDEADAHVMDNSEEGMTAEGEEKEEERDATPLEDTNLDEHHDVDDEAVDFPQPDDDGPEDDSPPQRDASPDDQGADHGGEEEEDDDDDDLAPPPPPPQPDSAAAEDDEDDQVDFPAAGDDYNDDDDKEGKGYRMADDDKDRESDSEDQSPSDRSRNRARRLKEAANRSSSDEDGDGLPPSSAKASRSKKQSKKKKRTGSDSDSDDSTDVRFKKSKKKKSKRTDSDDDDDDSPDSHGKMPAVKKAKKPTKSIFSPKGVPLPRTYHTSPFPHTENVPDSAEGLRRSNRARIAPLAYWKGESIEYGPNDVFDSELYDNTARTMPVPVGIRKSEPTPYKKRPPAPSKKGKGKKKKSNASSPSEAETTGRGEAMEPFDTRRLRRRFKYLDGEETRVWDDTESQITSLKVVSYPDNLHLRKLPVRVSRAPDEGDESGQAAQSFNVMHERSDYPSYLMGTLILPPGGVKDPESVGRSAQTFTVISCQPSSLEVAFGDPDEDEGSFVADTATRFFLVQDATFRIPPGNCYRLENHSAFADAKLTWTIIRQNAPETLVQDTEGEDVNDDDDDDEGAGDDDADAEAAALQVRGGRGGDDDDGDDDDEGSGSD